MRKLTVLDAVEDICRALNAKAYLPALAPALTIPDILSKIEYPTENKVGKRYERWINEFFLTKEEKEVRIKNLEETDELYKVLNRIDGRFYYRLRCAFLHSGNNDIEFFKDVEFDFHSNAEKLLRYLVIPKAVTGSITSSVFRIFA